MADSQAKITISAVDQASPVVAQIAAQFDALNANMSKLASGLGLSFQRTMEQFGQSSKGATESLGGFNLASIASVAAGLGLTMSLEAATRSVIDFAKETVNAGAEMQLLQTKAEVLFGSSFPQMDAAITQMAESLRRSKGEVEGFVTSADMFTHSMGMSTGQSQELSLGMADLAVKIGEATGTNEQEGFSMLERGLRGFGRALVDVGIDLSAHQLQQYMTTEGIKGTYTALDDASKALVAYHYLLTQETTLNEMAAKNTGSYSEKVKELGADWATLEETLGHLTVGPATSILGGLDDMVMTLDSNLNRLTKDFSVSNLFNLAAGVDQAGGDYVPSANPAGPQTQDEYLQKTLGLSAAQADAAKSGEDWKATLKDMPDVTGKAGKAADALQASLESLDARYQTATEDIALKLDNLDRAHEDKMASIRDQIDKVKQSVLDLKDAYTQAMDDIAGKEADAVGKQVTDIQKLKDELEDLKWKKDKESQAGIDWFLQYRSKDNEGQKVTADEKYAYGFSDTAVKQIDDTIKIQQMQMELDDYKKTHPTEYAAGVAEGVKSPFAQSIESAEAEKAKKTATYTKDVGKKDDEIASLQQKAVAEAQAYGATRSEIIETQSKLQGFHDTLVIAMEHMELVSKQKLQSMTQEFNNLTKAISQAQSQLASLRGGAPNVNLDSYLARKIQLQAQGVQ